MNPRDYTEQVISDALQGCEDSRAAAVAAAIVLSGIAGATVKQFIPEKQMHYFDAMDKSLDVLITAVQALLETYEEDRAKEVCRLLDAMTGAMLTYDTITSVQRRASAG